MKGHYYISTFKNNEHEEHKKIMDHLDVDYIAKKRLVQHGRFLYYIYAWNMRADQQHEAHRLTSLVGKPGTDIPEWRRK